MKQERRKKEKKCKISEEKEKTTQSNEEPVYAKRTTSVFMRTVERERKLKKKRNCIIVAKTASIYLTYTHHTEQV